MSNAGLICNTLDNSGSEKLTAAETIEIISQHHKLEKYDSSSQFLTKLIKQKRETENRRDSTLTLIWSRPKFYVSRQILVLDITARKWRTGGLRISVAQLQSSRAMLQKSSSLKSMLQRKLPPNFFCPQFSFLHFLSVLAFVGNQTKIYLMNKFMNCPVCG